PGSRPVLAGRGRGRHGAAEGVRDAGHRALERRRRDTAPLPASHDARGMAQSPVGGAGLEFRTEDARGPLLSQPAGPADGGGGLDPVCRGERGPNGQADRVLVVTGTGGGGPPRGVTVVISDSDDIFCTSGEGQGGE